MIDVGDSIPEVTSGPSSRTACATSLGRAWSPKAKAALV